MNSYLLNSIEEGPITLRTLSLEVVKYEIFLLQENNETNIEDLENYRIKCLALVTSLTSEYIWNNEGFNLIVGKSDGIPCLLGATDFGDFIEDEWLIVWLLFQITDAFPQLACRARDTDGEFLLIEAADHIPKWLNIDTSKNRVFVYQGHVHIIPKPQTPGEIAKLPVGRPTLKSALASMQFHPGLTQAHVSVSQCIQKRIAGYPQKEFENVQKVNVFIPEMIVRILDHEPNLISSAIRAFYYRDPIDLRSCRVFEEFPPDTRVWSQISMNRCSYAQLMQQAFHADRRSGYFVPKTVGADYKGMDLGSKIAHGFEILCACCSKSKTNNIESIFDEVGFEKYIAALEKRDYFRGEIEGSKLHKELLENARIYFTNFSKENSEMVNEGISATSGKRIMDVKNKIMFDELPLRKLSKATTRTELLEEDSDEWMYLDDEKIDDVLSEMKKGFNKLGRKNLDNKTQPDLELGDLCDQMQNFVTNLSGYEGVECPSNSDSVKFDAKNFEAAVNKLSMSRNQNYDEYSSDEFLTSEEEDSSDLDEGVTDDNILDAMKQMDAELSNTKVGQSFTPKANTSKEDAQEIQPVDIDLNLVQNFLKSCEGETDLPGPASTLLQSLGLNLDTRGSE